MPDFRQQFSLISLPAADLRGPGQILEMRKPYHEILLVASKFLWLVLSPADTIEPAGSY